MSIKETIARLEEMADDREDKILPGCIGWDEIEPLREAAALLRTHPDAQPNEPLTLDELRGMDVQPIYVVDRVYPPYSGWWIIGWTTGGCCVLAAATMRGTQYIVQNYGIGWVAYRRPPKEEHHEETP